MQWSVLSESTIIHQALQIVPVLSWRGSRCAQIMSLTPAVWGVNRGGEVRHDALSSSKRKRFIVTSSITPTKRHNHFISSLNFVLSAHFAWVSFIWSSFIFLVTWAFCLFSVFLFVFYIIVFICLPPFSIILSLFLFLPVLHLIFMVYLSSIRLSVLPSFLFSIPSCLITVLILWAALHWLLCDWHARSSPPLTLSNPGLHLQQLHKKHNLAWQLDHQEFIHQSNNRKHFQLFSG